MLGLVEVCVLAVGPALGGSLISLVVSSFIIRVVFMIIVQIYDDSL